MIVVFRLQPTCTDAAGLYPSLWTRSAQGTLDPYCRLVYKNVFRSPIFAQGSGHAASWSTARYAARLVLNGTSRLWHIASGLAAHSTIRVLAWRSVLRNREFTVLLTTTVVLVLWWRWTLKIFNFLDKGDGFILSLSAISGLFSRREVLWALFTPRRTKWLDERSLMRARNFMHVKFLSFFLFILKFLVGVPSGAYFAKTLKEFHFFESYVFSLHRRLKAHLALVLLYRLYLWNVHLVCWRI